MGKQGFRLFLQCKNPWRMGWGLRHGGQFLGTFPKVTHQRQGDGGMVVIPDGLFGFLVQKSRHCVQVEEFVPVGTYLIDGRLGEMFGCQAELDPIFIGLKKTLPLNPVATLERHMILGMPQPHRHPA